MSVVYAILTAAYLSLSDHEFCDFLCMTLNKYVWYAVYADIILFSICHSREPCLNSWMCCQTFSITWQLLHCNFLALYMWDEILKRPFSLVGLNIDYIHTYAQIYIAPKSWKTNRRRWRKSGYRYTCMMYPRNDSRDVQLLWSIGRMLRETSPGPVSKILHASSLTVMTGSHEWAAIFIVVTRIMFNWTDRLGHYSFVSS